MAKKNILFAIVFAVLVFSLALPVLAATSVSTWCSDVDSVAYTPYDGSYYVYNLSTNSSFGTNFRTAISRAISQWNPVLPINISETSFNYALNYIYASADVVAEVQVSSEVNSNVYSSIYTVDLVSMVKGPETAVPTSMCLPPNLEPNTTYIIFLKETTDGDGTYSLFSRSFPIVDASSRTAEQLVLERE